MHLDGVELDYVYQERRPKDVPIYIGATGMKMMELSGEIADGVVLNYLVGPDYNRQAMEHLQIGLEQSGRTLDDIDRPQLVVCSVHEDRQTALDMARLMVTQYLGQQPHIMKASGVPQSLLDKVGEVLTWPATHEQVEAASKLVPDEIVQMLTASGTPADAKAKVDEYIASGATCPILYPLGDVLRDDRRLLRDAHARPARCRRRPARHRSRAARHDGRRAPRAARRLGRDHQRPRSSAIGTRRRSRARRPLEPCAPTAAWSPPAWSTPTTTCTRTSPGPTRR